MTYLRNQLLRDSDWASMDHSVELRTPLVDSWLLREVRPVLAAFGRFKNKRLLGESARPPLSESLIMRRKTGFSIPVQRWLAGMGRSRTVEGKSRDWARQLVADVYGRS
jgi:asparagine synthase (glutamine-hydrolysing)